MHQAITFKIANELCSYHRNKTLPPLSFLSTSIDTLRRIFTHRHPATVGDKALQKLVLLSKKRGGPAQLFQTDLVQALTDIAVAFKLTPPNPIETGAKKCHCENCPKSLTCACSTHKDF
jgi:hypothetical protein